MSLIRLDYLNIKNRSLAKIKTTIFGENGESILGNSLFSIAGMLISRGLVFISWILVARIISTDDYGTIGLVRSTFNALLAFGNFGLGMYATREISRINDDRALCSAKISFLLNFGVLFNLVAGFIIWVASNYFLKNNIATSGFLDLFNSAYLIIPFALMSLLLNGIISGLEKYRKLAMLNSIHGLITFSLLLVSSIFGSITDIANAFFGSYAVAFFLYMNLFRKTVILSSGKSQVSYKNECASLAKYCLPGFLAGLLYIPIRWICEIMIYDTPNGAEQLGLFYAAQIFNVLFIMFAYNLSLPIFTRLTKGDASKDLRFLNMHLNWHLGILISLPFIMYPPLISVIFGEQYNSNVFSQVFYLTILYTVIFMYKQGVGRVIASDGRTWLFFADNLVFALVLLAAFTLDEKNAIALAQAYVFAAFSSSLFLVSIYKNKLGLTFREVYCSDFLMCLLMIMCAMKIGLVFDSNFVVLLNTFISIAIIFILMKHYNFDRLSKII